MTHELNNNRKYTAMLKKAIKKVLIAFGMEKTFLYWALVNRLYLKKAILGMRGVYPRDCPICCYCGLFRAMGIPPRLDARCPNCGSLERHRLFILLNEKINLLDGVTSILHFAPEPAIEKYLRQRIVKYISADLYKRGVDRNEDIENISLPSGSIDAVFCSMVLEHVDDTKAMEEVYRILKPGGGIFIAIVPICEGWDATYENPEIKSPAERDLHFGQYNHVRYYGRDFPKRLEKFGFQVSVFSANHSDTVKYGLQRGEKIFVGKKP